MRKPETTRLMDDIGIGTLWKHSNGNVYRVVLFTNISTNGQEKYPTTAVYRNVRNAALHSRRVIDWHRSMTPIHDDQEGYP